MTLILKSSDEIRNGLQMWGKTAKEQDSLLHGLAVQCILHAATHGDCGLVGVMFDEIRDNAKSFKVRYLARWVAQYTPIVFETNKGSKDKVWRLAKEGEEAYKPFAVDAADLNPFYASIPREEPGDLDINAVLKVIKGGLGTLRKAIADGRYKGDIDEAGKFISRIETALTLGTHIASAEANKADNAAEIEVNEAPQEAVA